MFILDGESSSDQVCEYSLSTDFDIDTKSFTDCFDVSSEDTIATGISFNDDGTKMFMSGKNNDNVYEYSLSTVFDISTASYSSNSHDVSGEVDNPEDVDFNSDGTKMFVPGDETNDQVCEYTLSTGYDITTASSEDCFDTSDKVTTSRGIAFNSDGTEMSVIDQFDDVIHRFDLSTGYDVSTGSSTSTNLDVGTQYNSPTGVSFDYNGSEVYVTGSSANNVSEYHIQGESFNDIAGSFILSDFMWFNASFSGNLGYRIWGRDADKNWNVTDDQSFDVERVPPSPQKLTDNTSGRDLALGDPVNISVQWRDDETGVDRVFLATNDTGSFTNHSLNNLGFEVSETAAESTLDVSTRSKSPEGLAWNSNGSMLHVVGVWYNNISKYSLPTPFDITTATFHSSLNVTAANGGELPRDVAWNDDGTKLYVVFSGNENITQYSVSTKYEVSTATKSETLNISGDASAPEGIGWNNDGSKLYVADSNLDEILEYDLSTKFDISSASLNDTTSVRNDDDQPRGITWRESGSKFFIAGDQGNDVLQYTVSTPFDTSSASFQKRVGVQDSDPKGVRWSDDGGKLYIAGSNNHNVYQRGVGRYSSPIKLQSRSNVWNLTEFEWKNSSFQDGRIGYRVWANDSTDGNWNASGIRTFKVNEVPDGLNATVERKEVGGSSTKDLVYGYNDVHDNVSSVASPPSGSMTATNNTATVTGWTSKFDWIASVTDFDDFTGYREINFTAANDFTRAENATGGVNRTFQTLNTTANITIRGDAMNYSITVVHPDEKRHVLRDDNETTGAGHGTTGEVFKYWYWLVDGITTTTFTETQDNSSASNTTEQRIHRDRQFDNNLSTAFDRFNTTDPPSISGSCTNCDFRTITVGATTAVNATYNATGDWVDEASYGKKFLIPDITDDTTETFTINRSYNTTSSLPIDLFVQFNFTDQYDRAIWSPPDGDNLTDWQITTGENRSYVQFNVTGTPVPEVKTPTCPEGHTDFGDYCKLEESISGGTQYTYTQYLEPKTIEVENTTIVHSIDDSRLLDWDNRNILSVKVNDTEFGVSYTADSNGIDVTINTSYSDSSLEDQLYDTEVKYDNTGEDTSSGGGGSGSGGGGTTRIIQQAEPDSPPVEVKDWINISLIGFQAVKEFSIENNRDHPVNVTVTPVRGDGCQRIRLDAAKPGQGLIIQVRPAGVIQQATPVSYRVTPPDNATTFTCHFDVTRDGKLVDRFAIKATNRPIGKRILDFIQWLLDLLPF